VGCRAARVVRRRRVGAVRRSRSWHLSAYRSCARKRWRAASSHCRRDAGRSMGSRSRRRRERSRSPPPNPRRPQSYSCATPTGQVSASSRISIANGAPEVELVGPGALQLQPRRLRHRRLGDEAGALRSAKRYPGLLWIHAVRTASRGHLLARSPSLRRPPATH